MTDSVAEGDLQGEVGTHPNKNRKRKRTLKLQQYLTLLTEARPDHIKKLLTTSFDTTACEVWLQQIQKTTKK